jgi:hypothetical protein
MLRQAALSEGATTETSAGPPDLRRNRAHQSAGPVAQPGNTGSIPSRLYTLYAPPNHRDEHFDGKTTE